MSDGEMRGSLKLRLPATSANLGPGFDASAIAFDFYLEIEARAAETFSILATGRDADRCGALEDNLILGIYEKLLRREGKPVQPLAIRMKNGIPLGMGCGSSAAGRLAAIALANHFGGLKWTSERILEEASALEGHPDNVAACWLGGFVTVASEGGSLHVARVTPPEAWRAIVVLPSSPLSTSKARAILPDCYSREDVVVNIQSSVLLGLAFAQGRGDLLRVAMRDRIHQPYRAQVCELLPPLLPLAGEHGILGVALSGAGPSVLLIVENDSCLTKATLAILNVLQDSETPEILYSRLQIEGSVCTQG